MDLLNRAMQQASELLRSMTPRARLAAATLAGVLLASALYLLLAPAAGPDTLLLGGHEFSTSELPAVQAAFAKAGLSDFEVTGGQIRIPRRQQALYLAALAEGGALPSSLADRLVDIVGQQSPFASRAQQEQMQRAVIQSMIAKSIARMSGVESAELFLDTQPRRGFRAEPLSTASVHVKTIGSVPLTPDKVRAIRGLVSGAVAGMAPESVTVIDSTGQHWSGESAVGSGGLDDPYLARKLTYEEGYAAKILASLAYVPGVTVSVNVELSTERRRTGSRQTIEPAAVASPPQRSALVGGPPARSTTPAVIAQAAHTATALHAQQSNVPATLDTATGQPAAAPAIGAAAPIASVVTTERPAANRSAMTRGATVDSEQFEIVGLTPERVTVSVVVPTTYFEDIWRRHNSIAGQTPLRSPSPLEIAPIEAEERARIQATVLAQIPHDPGMPAAELVSVTAFTPITPAPLVIPTVPIRIRNWLNAYWPAVAFIVLPLAALAFLWRQWNSSTPGLPTSPARANSAHHGAGSHESTLDATLDETAELVTADGYRYGIDDDQIDAQSAATRTAGKSTRHSNARPNSPEHDASRGGRRPFDVLHDAHGRDIASLLAGEQPQTIAVIVGHLPPDQAAEVVDALPAPLQADVLARVMRLEATAPEVLHDIESALAARLAELPPRSDRAADGWNTAQQILAAGGPEFAARMARRLAPHDQHLAAQFESVASAHTPVATHVDHHAATAPAPSAHETPWAFEELDRLSEADLRYVAAAANHDLLELALAGATPELAERVLRALSPDQSRSLRNRLDRLAPTRMSDITQAQRELARLAFELLAATRDSATTGTRLVA